MSFTEGAKNLLLQEWVADVASHLTLMNGPANSAIDYDNELGYRHLLNFSVSDGIASNSNVITIPVNEPLSVTHIGLTDNINPGSGTLWMVLPLKKPVKINRGGKFRLEIGDLQVSLFDHGPTLGYNVEPNKSGTFGTKFLDCFKAGHDVSGTLAVQDDGREISRDSNGWPSALLPDQVVRWHVPTYFSGTYRLEWDGTGTLVVENGTSITNIDATTIEFDAQEQETIRIRWDTVGPVNARCFLASFATNFNNGEVYIQPFVARTSEANALRFGDAFNIRALPITSSFSDRPLPTDASEAVDFTGFGMSIESMCELCNQSNADLWFCMPVSWVDGGVNIDDTQPSWTNPNNKHPGGWTEQQANQVANIIKNNLNAHLKVYVEHGNNLLSLEEDNIPNYQLANSFSIQVATPTYQANGRILINPSNRDRVYAYHAWRTSRIGKEFKKVLTDRVETVLTMESGDRSSHEKVYQFLVKQEILGDIDVIALNPTLGNRVDEPILASYLLNRPTEAVVLDVEDASGLKFIDDVNLTFTRISTGVDDNRSFLESTNWDVGSEEQSARNLMNAIASYKPEFTGITIGNRIIVTTPGWETTVNSIPPGISGTPVLQEDVISDVLTYSFNNYYSTVNNNNRLTAEQFGKPLYASTLGLRDEGGDDSIAWLREILVEDNSRLGVLAGMIGKWRQIAAPTYTGSDDSAPTLIVLDSRWGGTDWEDPKSTRQIIVDYNDSATDSKRTALSAVFGRDANNYAQGMLNNVFGGIADVVITHLNLLDADMNEISITSRLALPAGIDSGAGLAGKRTNSSDLVFSPSGSPGTVAHYLGFYTSATGNTLVASTKLTDKVIVQDSVNITFPANSIIIAG